jgi:hypothetical protein
LAARPTISRLNSGSLSGPAGSQVGDTCALICGVAQRPIEVGPTLGLDLPFQRRLDLPFAARPQRDAVFGARPAEGEGEMTLKAHKFRTTINRSSRLTPKKR